jgi:1,2-diacylglycerol 3-alpha-glucosyltransferase
MSASERSASSEGTQRHMPTGPLRICMVTPFLPRHDGIATYSAELISAIEQYGHTVYVISHPDLDVGGHEHQKHVFGLMDIQKKGWERDVFKKIQELQPDVVHIQHEYGLYATEGDYGIPIFDLMFLLCISRIPFVITYHSVFSTLSHEEAVFTSVSLSVANAGIVHEEFQKVFLPINLGWVPDNVYVIHHGAKSTFAEAVPSVNEAKKLYGLEGKKVVLCIGWWEPNKRFEDVVTIWQDIVKEVPDSVLVIAGDARPGSPSGIAYKPKLMRTIERSPVKDKIQVITGAFTPKDYDIVLNTADIVVLPYDRASQSGNLAHSFALGKPAVVTAVEGLKAEVEASGAGIDVPLGSLEDLKAAIMSLLRDEELRELYAKRAREYVHTKIGWSIVAQKHIQLYKIIMKREHMKITPVADLDTNRG